MQYLVRYCGRMLLLGALCALVSAGLLAQSQMTTGAISGTITDEGGGVLPGAGVTLRNAGTGLERRLTTDSVGRFNAPLLPVGDYEVTADLPGFATVKRSGVTLALGQTLVIDLKMKVVGTAETITVTGAAPIIETEKSETSTLVDTREVQNLPLNGRRFTDLAFLTPGVSQDRERGQLTFSGSRGINSNINIDGADFNQPFFGGQRGGERTNDAYVVSQEAVREFQVIRGNFNSEFGRSTAGVVNVITKSGTNDFHGGAFYYLRAKGSAAHNLFGDKVSPNRHQFGGSVGGPLVKDKTFFFTVYDQQKQTQDLVVRFSNPGTLPDSVTGQQGTFKSTNDINTYLIKLDHQLTNKHSLSGRYNYSRNQAENGTTTGSTDRTVSSNGFEGDRTHTVVTNLNSVFSPTLLNEFRWQYSFEDRPRRNNGEGFDFINKVGPEVQVRGCCTMGGVSFLPILQNDSRLQFADNVSVIRGRHSWKFGYDFNRSHVDQIFRGNWRGVYIFNTVSNFLANLNNPAANAADEFRIFFGPGNFVASVYENAMFAQDTIKLYPNLTLNLGLRYEAAILPQPINPNPQLPQTAKIHSDKKMWQPRFGLTWDPTRTGRTVLRIGGGLFNSRTPLLLLNQAFNSNGSADVGVGFTLDAPLIRQARTAHPEFVFPFVPDTSRAAGSTYFTAVPGFDPSQLPRPDAAFFSDDFRNPRALQYTAALEHEVTKNMVASLEYVHVNTVWLERIRDVNLGPPTVGPGGRNMYTNPRPNPNYRFLRQQENSARSNYDSLTVLIKGRQVKGLSFLTSYTLAYNRDDDSNERNFAGITYEDVNNLHREYRWSRNDIRHRWVGSGVYDLPYRTSRYNIQLGTIFRYESGAPFSAFVGSDVNRDGQNTDRPIINGVPLLRSMFRQPNSFNQDLRVTQAVKMMERHRFDIIFECFNLWNRKNYFYSSSANESAGAAGSRWGSGQTPIIDPDFRVTQFRNRELRTPLPDPLTGTITERSLRLSRGAIGPGSPFQLQVAIKYIF
ncbi:MAG: TonB-dependent receptor [Acidobacteria bacterium]|nr:TonB-dependent receptor [Acidobacteriota bacterium]MBI3656293.1 TonB-dependent receptor [Acidobacteriota bacterium]